MEINSLIKILKKKLTKKIKINNIKIEDKSFLHQKHKNHDLGVLQICFTLCMSNTKQNG